MRIFREVKNLIGCILGSCLISLGTACFLLPNKLSSGGFGGISTILYYFFDLNMSITTIALNIPILIWAFLKLGKKYTFRSIISIFVLSIFYDLFLEIPITIQDSFLACIYGGIIIGIGLAIVMKMDSSTGGSDLLAYLLKNTNNAHSISEFLLIIDAIIIILNMIVFKTIEIGLYSFITIYIVGKMVDLIFEGINFCKKVIIISDEVERIAEVIMMEFSKGTTGIYGRGMYKNIDKLMLMCVVKKNELPKVLKKVSSIDSDAFIIISDAREVYGLGFKEEF